MPKRKQRVRCDHCGRPIRGYLDKVTVDGVLWMFHADRRACRRARYETVPSLRIDPPTRPDEVSDSVLVSALRGFDCMTLPWWMRWVPERQLNRLRFDVAVMVGGIVERRIAVNAMGLEDVDG